MTESERCTKELIRSVNSNKNKSHRIYSVAMAELIAEKYGGSLSTAVEGELFHLNIYLMEQ